MLNVTGDFGGDMPCSSCIHWEELRRRKDLGRG